jgi:hypothetical protein
MLLVTISHHSIVFLFNVYSIRRRSGRNLETFWLKWCSLSLVTLSLVYFSPNSSLDLVFLSRSSNGYSILFFFWLLCSNTILICVSPVVSALFATTNILTVNTQHFYSNLKQLRVSAAQGSHHQSVYCRNVKGEIYTAVGFEDLTKGSLALTVCVIIVF